MHMLEVPHLLRCEYGNPYLVVKLTLSDPVEKR